MSAITVLWKKLSAFIFFFINIGKRLLCFLKIRRRKNSGNLLPLANHYPSPPDVTHAVPGNEADLEMEAWDSWGVENTNTSANKNQTSNYSNSNHAGYYGNRNQPEPEPFNLLYDR
ncbi:uncharacterized protein LOC106161569 [Lingula anatina]|uniref:Uncharacterized protein LOC106161569 n=1 Tax=Lingula anatina TaxID=7574 RepID=A0A1S3I6W4_LINAN|nr:uncharacterized protein LOC106161569 [Lingula anatina]|eukprot:XP_013394020.1 uncharacterized protein LOC106161569 [Lingula anatina]